MTFRSRIIAGYATLLVVTVAVLLLSLRILLETYAMKQLDLHHAFEARELTQEAEELEHSLIEGTAPLRDAHLSQHLRIAEDMYKFHLVAADGRIVYRSPALASVPTGDFAGRAAGLNAGFAGLGDCWITEHPMGGYTLRIVTPVTEALKGVRHFEKVALGVLVAAALLSLLTGAGYAAWLVRPLVRLEEAAGRIDAGTADRIPASIALTRDEVGLIARRLNTGYERLAGSIDRLRVFSAEVSHELRTPLSIVRLNAERIRDHPASPPAAREMAEEQIAEIFRLKRFIENLLGFAKLDAGAVRMDIRSVDTTAWVSGFAEDASALAEDVGMRFECFNTCRDPVSFDPVWIRQVLFNLLANALRFSPKGGLLSLSVFRDDTDLVITFTDEGPGVPPGRLTEIFERYTRFGEERGPAEGVGIGLAICRSVIALHGGSITAENRTDRSGLRVILRLPQAG